MIGNVATAISKGSRSALCGVTRHSPTVCPANQQLQRTDIDETVCRTSSPCDVPASTNTLLNFGTNSATRSRMTVGAPVGGDVPSTVRRSAEGLTASCSTGRGHVGVACPVGNVPISIMCDASVLTTGRDSVSQATTSAMTFDD